MIKILEFQLEDKRWLRIPKLRARLEQAAQVTLKHLPKNLRFACSASVLLTGDTQIKRLNRDFRGFDKATNVLSFPQFEPHQLPKQRKNGGQIQLGDIILAYQYIVLESRKEHKILINHAIHLLIHGLLHLFGYDHPSDKDAARMEGLEKTIMKQLGLPDPYAPLEAAEKTKVRARKPRKQRK